MNPTQNASLLDRAAAHIERFGWTQGFLYDTSSPRPLNQCPVCAVGAMYMASIGTPEPNSVDDELHALELAKPVEEHLGLNEGELPDWNDAPGRTKNEVAAALRATAVKLRQHPA
ncbi:MULTISPECIES: hypothetical protein [unclassified Streptomyces]|uniref:DUF6197 family protein n=1 Tax=unclassified Streptomyces TaxID=2593676 RepID=UPI001438C774|nr:hypothetical protein [Streptomyces sp. NEAU-H3]NJA56702.1 hypothetical protein [Streptomyces sp. NEAU-H3]